MASKWSLCSQLIILKLSTSYPRPHIYDIVNKIAQYHVFIRIDLRSMYHQILIKEQDKPYTALEACDNFYHFNGIPFGVINGITCLKIRGLWTHLFGRNSWEAR